MAGFNIKNIFNKINLNPSSKRYTGVLSGGLPKKATSWGPDQFLRAQEISLYTNRALARRSEKVGEIEFLVQDKNGEEIEESPLLKLLHRPNKVFTGRQFWSLYQNYLDAVGEVYIYVEYGSREIFEPKNIIGLHLLIPTKVKPHFDENGVPTKYVYKTGDKDIEYDPKNIIYVHSPDPMQPLRGQSLLKSGVSAIQTESEISQYHSKVLENGGKVEGVFKFKTAPLTEEQLKNVKDRYQKEYGQAKKAGLPLFLGGDADYVKTGLTPDELSFLEAKKMTLEDICILTGVPKSVLGSYDDVQYSNADTALRVFLRETVNPLLKTLTTALDEKLFPDDQTLTYVDPTPENIEDKIKETESGMKNYYMKVNEARERHGLDPVDEGDVIMVPFSVMPLGEDRAEPEEEDDDDDEETTEEKKIKSSDNHPLQDKDVREMWAKIQVKRMDAREKKFKSEINKYFKDQKKRLIESVQPNKQRVFRKKELFDEVMELELEVSIGKEAFIPVLTELLEQAGIDAMELAGSTYGFNMTAEIGTWIEQRSGIFMRQINETTFAKLKDQFTESFEEGESREDLVKRIEETYKTITKNRAQTIARTETHNATQQGTMAGYKQAGLNIKIWTAVLDSSTRHSHATLDGEERPIDAAFSNGLEYPGDPKGPAEEVINCRCVI